MMRSVITLCFCVVLSGCSSLFSAKIPDWWTHTPVDSEQWMYGVGEGANADIAQQQALTYIAGKLKTRVSSQLSVKTTETNTYYAQYAERNIRSSIQNTDLSHFQIQERVVDSSAHITRVLIRLDRQALAQAWRNQYQELSQKVTQARQREAAQSLFAWWMNARATLPVAQQADVLALQLGALLNRKSTSNLWTDLQQLIRQTPIQVGVDGDNSAISQQVTDLLNQQELRVVRCSSCDLKLSYHTKVDYQKIFDQQVATLEFYGELKDAHGLVSQQHWIVQGSSITNTSFAYKAASAKAAEYIQKHGLWKSFGLDQD
ncbi:hypothetical protein [Celerinatantimonas sp. YJH-8]|uniref:hypothetical protein n=1 Tax=Celerinatantimonas sp. YJH-8 TaxID=3228714 RepID=UPI0038C2A6D7